MIQHNMFQSTRPRGARHGIKHGLMIFLVQFQSTRPRGARRTTQYDLSSWVIVSIHAPAWGATYYGSAGHVIFSGFNPRARVGRD